MVAPPHREPVLEPIPGARAAIANLGDERALVIADYHAGYEAALRYERGVDVPNRAERRRERLLELVDDTAVDRLVVCGDLMHSIGEPGGAERGELEVLFESLSPELTVTVVKGNHDGAIETWLDTEPHTGVGRTAAGADDPARDSDTAGSAGDPARHRESVGTARGPLSRVEIVPGAGTRLGPLGVCHGHTWPSAAVLDAEVICCGHEHPCVRLEDTVGGSRVEPVWLRGRLDPAPFQDHGGYEELSWLDGGDPPQLVVAPAFNELVGGTWVNLPDQAFLSPFLPAGLARGEAFLLDGTRLGPYDDC